MMLWHSGFENSPLRMIPTNILEIPSRSFLVFLLLSSVKLQLKEIFPITIKYELSRGERNAKSRFLQIGTILVFNFFSFMNEV